MTVKKYLYSIVCILFFANCGGGGDDGPAPLPQPPTAAELVFPLENSECTEGVITASNLSTSTITFEWELAENTDSYELTVTNLNTNNSETFTSLSGFQEVTLNRGVPYSWYITSKNSETLESAKSAIWKFYNAGEGATNYPPFPADLLEPTSGYTVYSTNSSISFLWKASDIDNDILSYSLFLGTNNPPDNSIATNISEQNFIYATPAVGTYYWLIKTEDANGNISTSQVSEFKIE